MFGELWERDVDDALTFVSASSWPVRTGGLGAAATSPRDFDGAVPITLAAAEAGDLRLPLKINDQGGLSIGRVTLHAREHARTFLPPVRISAAIMTKATASDGDGSRWVLDRVREHQASTNVRGVPRGRYSRTFEWRRAWIHHSGEVHVTRANIGWDGRWNFIRADGSPAQEMQSVASGVGDWAVSVLFLTLKQWSVSLAAGDSPSLRFLTDADGVRALFRYRDLGPGMSRRTPLRHWVRNHWRKSRTADRETVHEVMRHLRGAKSFSWHGMRCEVAPSFVDLNDAGVSFDDLHPNDRLMLASMQEVGWHRAAG